MARLIFVALLVTTHLLVDQSSHASSCGERDSRDRVAEADGAFIGELLTRVEGTDSEGFTYADLTFDVEESVKGEVPDVVEVRDTYNEIEIDIGTRVGLLLFGSLDNWRSNLCALIGPKALREAAAPLPEPDGSGDARFVVGGNYGETRLLVLDRKGRTLAYGYGDGYAIDVASCPGGDTFLELRSTVRSYWLTACEAQTAEILWQRRVWRRTRSDVDGPDSIFVRCNSAAADRGVVALGSGKSWTVRRVGAQVKDEIQSGRGGLVSLSNRKAYVERGGDRRLIAIGLNAGEHELISGLDASPDVVVSDTGVVALVERMEKAARLTVVGLDGVPVVRRLGSDYLYSEMTWTDEGSLAIAPDPYSPHPHLLVFNLSLDVIRRVGNWHAVDLSSTRWGVLGVGKGLIRLANLRESDAGWKRFIPTPETYAIEALR